MTGGTTSWTVEERFALLFISCQKLGHRIVARHVGTAKRGICLVMKESDDTGDLSVLQGGETRHSFVRPSIPDYRTQSVSILVTQCNRRADKIGRTRTSRVRTMAEAAGGLKK